MKKKEEGQPIETTTSGTYQALTEAVLGVRDELRLKREQDKEWYELAQAANAARIQELENDVRALEEEKEYLLDDLSRQEQQTPPPPVHPQVKKEERVALTSWLRSPAGLVAGWILFVTIGAAILLVVLTRGAS